MKSLSAIPAATINYHQLEVEIEEVPKYPRDRPPKGKPRRVLHYEYQLITLIRQDNEKVDPLRDKAGCFVLLTNLLEQQADSSSLEICCLK